MYVYVYTKLHVMENAVCFSVDDYLVNWCSGNTRYVFELQPLHWQLWETFLVVFLSLFMQMVQYYLY